MAALIAMACRLRRRRGVATVQIIKPNADSTRCAPAADTAGSWVGTGRPAWRQEPYQAMLGRDPALLSIAEGLSRRVAGAPERTTNRC